MQKPTVKQVSKLLKEKAVVLRLNAGSQEAGFLSSFCPVGDIPTLVVVKYVLLSLLRGLRLINVKGWQASGIYNRQCRC